MDDFLDAMYGTRENIGGTDLSELEKNAEAELLFDALKQEGYNTDQIDTMSADDVVKVAMVLFGEDSALVKAAMEEGKTCPHCGKEGSDCKCPAEKTAAYAPSGEESFEEKVAHADKLGRVMAHSFVDEVSNIEKNAQYEQIKEAKLAQIEYAYEGAAQLSPGEKIAAELAYEYQPEANQEKIAVALALLDEVDEFNKDAGFKDLVSGGKALLGRAAERAGSAGKSISSKARSAAEATGSAGKSMSDKARRAYGNVANPVGRAFTEGVGRVGKGGFPGAGKMIGDLEARLIGKNVLKGGGAAVGAGAAAVGGAGYALGKD